MILSQQLTDLHASDNKHLSQIVVQLCGQPPSFGLFSDRQVCGEGAHSGIRRRELLCSFLDLILERIGQLAKPLFDLLTFEEFVSLRTSGRLELGSSLRDPLFQISIEEPQFFLHFGVLRT